MRKIAILILCFSFLGLTGCDKDAEQYARDMVMVLKSYQEQVNRKMKAEQDSYKELAAIYAQDQKESLTANLRQERLERAAWQADEVIRGKNGPIMSSDIQKMLLDYAYFDFDATRNTLQQETDAQKEYLANLENLDIESKKLEVLTEAFTGLAKSKNIATQLRELVAFGNCVKTDFNIRLCKDLTTKIEALGKSIEELQAQLAAEPDTAKKKEIEAKISAANTEREMLVKEKETKKCAQLDSSKCAER